MEHWAARPHFLLLNLFSVEPSCYCQVNCCVSSDRLILDARDAQMFSPSSSLVRKTMRAPPPPYQHLWSIKNLLKKCYTVFHIHNFCLLLFFFVLFVNPLPTPPQYITIGCCLVWKAEKHARHTHAGMWCSRVYIPKYFSSPCHTYCTAGKNGWSIASPKFMLDAMISMISLSML